MANASYDTLTIKINADSKQANSSISKLSNNLQKLNDTAKGLDVERINEVKGLLLDIASIDFSNVSKGLQDVVSAFKAFNNAKFMKQSQNGTDFASIKQPLTNSQEALGNITIPNAEGLENIKDTVNEIGNSLVELGHTASKTLSAFDNGVKEVAESVKETNEAVKGATKSVAKMFLNILKYRIVRKIIQTIYQAFQQGIQNVAQFDVATGEAFTQIKASLGYLTDSLGSMLAPLIQAIQPVISLIADTVGDLANNLGQVFAEMNGQTTFAQATKDVEKYRNELKKTQSIGIDELNILQPEQSGSYEMVELTDSSSALTDTFAELSKILKDIFKLLKPILDILKPVLDIVLQLVNFLLPIVDRVLEPIIAVLNTILYLLKPIFDYIDNELKISLGLIEIVFDILSLDFTKAGEHANSLFNSIKQGFASVINFFVRILNTCAEYIERFFQGFIDAFQWLWGGTYQLNIGRIPEVSFATGGFPEDGFFFANHNELVGKFSDGKTAVANNEQIVEGIKQGVKEAMRESGGNNITIELDGYEVAKAITKRQNNFGDDVVLGGNIAFGR